MSRPPSIVSRHSSARNRMSVYSKLSRGIRSSNNSPCGSPRYWPVSMYSTHSRRHMPWSPRGSTLSGHRHSLPWSNAEAQNKGKLIQSKETLPCVEERPLHPIDDSIAGCPPIQKRDSSSMKVNSTSSTKSSPEVFGGTVRASVEVDIVLATPATTKPASNSTLPKGLGKSSRLVTTASGQIAFKTLQRNPTSGIDDMLLRHGGVLPAVLDGTDTSEFATCRDDNGRVRSYRPHVEATSSDCLGFVPFASTARPGCSQDGYESKHTRPRDSISSMGTFNSDISDVYTVGHATSVKLPANPRITPLARSPTRNRPLSKYRVSVENRYAKALPSLPPTSPTQKRSELTLS